MTWRYGTFFPPFSRGTDVTQLTRITSWLRRLQWTRLLPQSLQAQVSFEKSFAYLYFQAADRYESRLLCSLSPLRQTMPFKPQTCHSAFYFPSRGITVNSWQLLRCVTTGCDNPPPDTKTHRTPPKNVFIYFSSSSSTHLNRQLEHCQANPFFAMFLNSRKTNARIPLSTGQRAE